MSDSSGYCGSSKSPRLRLGVSIDDEFVDGGAVSLAGVCTEDNGAKND